MDTIDEKCVGLRIATFSGTSLDWQIKTLSRWLPELREYDKSELYRILSYEPHCKGCPDLLKYGVDSYCKRVV